MRNGIVADTLRKAGSPYRIIFGLNQPQISEIARVTGCNHEMAETLLADNHTRREASRIRNTVLNAGFRH